MLRAILINNCPINPTHSCKRIEHVPIEILLRAARRELQLDVDAELQGITALERWSCLDCGLIFFTPWCPGGRVFYEKLGEHSWYQPASKWEYRCAAALLQETDRVLDIGCGDGRFHLSVTPAEYTGLDPNATQPCRELSPVARIFSESLEQHAAAHPAAYDAVCAFQVLEHVSDPRGFVEAALRCLRPGGRLVFGLPNRSSYLGGLMNFALDSPPHHLTSWNDGALQALEREVGISRVELRQAPLEDWECELYWMQRCYRKWRPANQRYSAKARWAYLIPLCYLLAKVLARTATAPQTVNGSTMLWVAER